MAAGGRLDGAGLLQQLQRRLHGAVSAPPAPRRSRVPGAAGVRLVVEEQDGELPGGEAVAGEEAFVGDVHRWNSKQDSGY